MKDITCPKCGTVFQVDESDYAAIVSQVRGKEFEKELGRRLEELKDQFKSKEEAVKLKAEKNFETRISEKDLELTRLQNEITRLSGVISGYEATKKSELAELEGRKDKEIFNTVSQKDKIISDLKNQIANKDNEHKVAILEERNAGKEELHAKEQEIIKLTEELKSRLLAAENRENQLREQHKLQLQDKQGEIDRLKDFKMRLSTKMIGETLEQHCSMQFEQAQSLGLYPDAYFAKDNTAVEHTKGDFIFRDYINGQEYVSVMFEMKNEMD